MNQVEIIESKMDENKLHAKFSGDNKKSEKKKIEMEFVEDNISIYSIKTDLKATQHSKVYSMNQPTQPIKDENGKETAPAFKKRMAVYDAEMVKYNEFIRANPPPPASTEESSDEEDEEEYDEDEEDGSEEGSDEEEDGSEEESDEEEETASAPASATVVIEEEEDEEALIMRRRRERQAIQDAEDEALLKKARAKKMMKDIDPLRAEAVAFHKAKIDAYEEQIRTLCSHQETEKAFITRIMAGEMDEELIKAKTDGIKIAPTAPQKTASVKAKTDGEATRTRTAVVNGDGKTRPKGGDIMTLFNRPALIRCVFGEQKTAYYGMVHPDKKVIKTVMKNGTFRFGTDKGVKSFDTKTVKITEDGKVKNKDVADTSQPARERMEWTTKDLWIKSCKGEQNLYSSTKDGWKEIYYWDGDARLAGQADNKDARWVHLHGVAYDGVKLN